MKNKRKIIAIIISSIIILLVLIYLVSSAILKKEISDKVIKSHCKMITNVELINDVYVKEFKYNTHNNTCDVLLDTHSNPTQYWYRISKNNSIQFVSYNKTLESGYKFDIPNNHKKRQKQYNAINYIKQSMYTNNSAITNDHEENEEYIIKMYLPEQKKEITAVVDSLSKDENGNYINIRFLE